MPVTRRSVGFYERPAARRSCRCATWREDPATGIALRGLTANATTLQPQLRYLGPYQTVCNYWTYFWTFLGEHVSQDGPYGYSQRAHDQEHGPADEQPELDGLAAARRTARATARPRARAASRSTCTRRPTTPRSTDDGERRLRERPARLHAAGSRASREPELDIVTDPHIPGDQGPTYTGRAARARGPDLHARARDREVHRMSEARSGMAPFRAGLIAIVLIAVGTSTSRSRAGCRSATTTRSRRSSAARTTSRSASPCGSRASTWARSSKVEHLEPGKPARRDHDADRGRRAARCTATRTRQDPAAAVPRGQLVPRPPARHAGAPASCPTAATIPVAADRAGRCSSGSCSPTLAGGHAREPPDAAARVLERARGRGRRRLPALDPLLGARLPQLGDRAGRHARACAQHDLSGVHRQRGPRRARARPQPRGAEGADRATSTPRPARSRARRATSSAAIDELPRTLARRAPGAARAERGVPAAAPLRARPASRACASRAETIDVSMPFLRQARGLVSERRAARPGERPAADRARARAPDRATRAALRAAARSRPAARTRCSTRGRTTRVPDPNFPANGQGVRGGAEAAARPGRREPQRRRQRAVGARADERGRPHGQHRQRARSRRRTCPMLGTNPPKPAARPPLRPDVACETQEPPDLRTVPGPGDPEVARGLPDDRRGAAALRARRAHARSTGCERQAQARGRSDLRVLTRRSAR